MVHGGISVYTGQLSRLGIPKQTLREGSQVLVRIIADKGGGRYEGSVAGARVSITSKQPLATGTTFTASITSKNGQILLTPNFGENNIAQQTFELSVMQNEQLASFIQSFGLPADETSFHLMQQMKQLGMKMDSALLAKIYNLSVKFKGKEKRATELLSILSKKGIDFSEEDLLALLQELDSNPDDQDDGQKSAQQEYKLLNKINSIKNTWQMLPYEIVSSVGPLAKGSLGFFVDEAASLKLLNVECNWLRNNHKYLFSLEYLKGQCTNIKMSGQGVDVSKLAYILDGRLSASGKQISIELVEPELIEGTACGQEEFFAFGGEV